MRDDSGVTLSSSKNKQPRNLFLDELKAPRIPDFYDSPMPSLSQSSNRKSSSHLSVHDLGSSILEYKKRVEEYENKKRKEMLSGQSALLDVYRNKISNHQLAIEEIKQEYERKLYEQKTELIKHHEEELRHLHEEEANRQFANKARIGALKEKLKAKYEKKLQEFHRDMEQANAAVFEKKLQFQGAIEQLQRELSASQHQTESIKRIHQSEVEKKDGEILQLKAQLEDHRSQDEEIIQLGVEIAALVVHMHQKGREADSNDLALSELYDGDPSAIKSDSKYGQHLVPTAYLRKALQKSKQVIQAKQDRESSK